MSIYFNCLTICVVNLIRHVKYVKVYSSDFIVTISLSIINILIILNILIMYYTFDLHYELKDA